MTDRGGGVSLLPYTPTGVRGGDDDDDDDCLVTFVLSSIFKGDFASICKP